MLRRDRALRSFLVPLIVMFTSVAGTQLACGPSDPLEAIREEQAKGHLEETIEPLRKLLRERPGDAELLVLYGRTLSATGQAALAEWSLREAMKDPDWIVPAGLQLAADAARGFNFPEAIETATRVLDVDPDNIDALLIRASAYTHSRMHHEEALADVDRVLELDPDNLQVMEPKILALIGLERYDEIEEALEELGRRIDESPLAEGATGWHCATTAIFAYESGELDLAKTRWKNCLEANPADPEVVNKALPFYDDQGQYERSIEILRKALEVEPDARGYRVNLAERLRYMGKPDDAEKVLLEGTKSDNPQISSAAWLDLSKHYQETEQYEASVDAVGKAVDIVETITNPSSTLLLEYADALLIAGHYDRALALADQMTYQPHQEMIRARVAQEQRDYTGALEHFDKAFVLWPDNPFARYHAARAAEALGDFDRAIQEYRYSIRIAPIATEARTRVARILMAEGRVGEAVQLLRIRSNEAPLDPDGELLSLELWAQTGHGADVDASLKMFRKKMPVYIGQAIAAVARGVYKRAGAEAAVKTIGRAGEIVPGDVRYADAIRTLLEYSLEAGFEVDKAQAMLDAAVAANPDAAAIREIVAFRLEATGAPTEEVKRAYNAVLEVDPKFGKALEGLGRIAAEQGKQEDAVSYFDRAAAANPYSAYPQVEAARALDKLGRGEEAEARLNKLMDDQQFDPSAAQLLAELQLARQDASDRTLDLARRAVRFGGRVQALDLLARVHEARGETRAAEEAAKKAQALRARESG